MNNSDYTLIELTPKQKKIYAISWMLAGVFSILLLETNSWFKDTSVYLIIFIAIFAGWLITDTASFLSLSVFLPRRNITYIMIFLFFIAQLATALISFFGPNPETAWYISAVTIFATYYVLFYLVKKQVWFIVLPMIASSLILSWSELTRDYIINPLVFETIQAAICALIGILYYKLEIKEQKPLKTVLTLTIIAVYIGASLMGAFGRTWIWEGQTAKAEMERYLSVSLPDDADNMVMEYESNPRGPRKVHLMFETPTEGLEAFVAQGVLTFETDLDDFYTEKERSAIKDYYHGPRVDRENSVVYDYDPEFLKGLFEFFRLQEEWSLNFNAVDDNDWWRFYFGRGDDDKYAVCQTGYPYNATYMMLIERSPREGRWIVDIYSFK